MALAFVTDTVSAAPYDSGTSTTGSAASAATTAVDVIGILKLVKQFIQLMGWEDTLWKYAFRWANDTSTPFDDNMVKYFKGLWDNL